MLPTYSAAYASVSNSPLTGRGVIASIFIQKVTNCISEKTPKNSINQMVKRSKKLINQLTKWVSMTKSHRNKATEMGGVSCMSAYYLKFYFPHTYMRPFFCSDKLQNKDKTETQNALCNFSKSPHMCKSLGYIAWCIMRLVHLAHI